MEKLCADTIRKLLPDGLTLGGEIHCMELVDSTNVRLKEMAQAGAPHGTVLIAEEQTGGRGRKGRRFESPAGSGLYFSLLLRPACEPMDTICLTPWTAVAVAEAIAKCCGVRPQIKWVNDLLFGGRKLCGILTELGMTPDGKTDHVIIGIGINLTQTREEFAELELGEIATSLAAEGVEKTDKNEVAAALICELEKLARDFPAQKERWLNRYRSGCITTGKDVRVIRGDRSQPAFALEVEEDFSLRVRYSDGTVESVNAGEVSVRGMMGQS